MTEASNRTDEQGGASSAQRKLPRGRHGLPREAVVRNQRERLIAALAEAVAERGYAATNVSSVCAQAAVSRTTFYQLFEGIQDCALKAFAEIFDRLVEEVEASCAEAGGSGEAARVGIGRALALLAADPPSARLLTVEILAAGPAGVRAQQSAQRRLAELLAAAQGGDGTRRGPADPLRQRAAVALLSTMVAERIVDQRAGSISGLGDELAAAGLSPWNLYEGAS